MKKLKNLLVIAFAVAIIVPFASCSDDDDATPTPFVKKLPTLIKWNRTVGIPIHLLSEATCAYDTQNRLTEYTEKIIYYGDKVYKSVIEYNAAGDVVTVKRYLNGENDRLSEFAYNDNTITNTVTYYREDGSAYLGYVDILKINDKKQLVEQGEVDGDNIEKHMYDSAGNIIRSEDYEGLVLRLKEEITYDNNYGLLSAINTPAWLFTYMSGEFLNKYYLVNNAIASKTTEYEDGVMADEDTDFMGAYYQYDNHYYPSVIPGDDDDLYTVTYKVVQ